MRVPQRQRGVALLVALLVVALAAILIAALLDRGELALARTRNLLRSEQAEAYAQGLETYAAEVLLATVDQQPDSDASAWAFPLPPQPVPGGLISATMSDRNGCFNLNNLAPTAAFRSLAEPVFINLLKNLGIDPTVDAAVVAWLSASTDNSGAELNYYLALPVPYRPPPSGRFTHVSELRLVRGVGSDVYARLAPHVCALPPGTAININTASVPVLQSLGNAMSLADAQRAWQDGHARYDDPSFFVRQFPGDPSLQTRTRLMTTRSSYFLARGYIELDDVPFTFYSLIERGANGIRVLERSRGSDDAVTAPVPVVPAGSTGAALR